MVVRVCVYMHMECMLYRANRNLILLMHLKSWLRPGETDSTPLQQPINYALKCSLKKKDNGEKVLSNQVAVLVFIPDCSQSSSVLWASFHLLSDSHGCVVAIRRRTKPMAPVLFPAFFFFSPSMTIPSGFGDLRSEIDFNSLGIKHVVLTLPSSCQSQRELNVVSKDFNIIPAKRLDGVLCYLNLH